MRIERDRTVERIATEASISKGYLSMIEGGKRLPHWSVVFRILRALDTTLCRFLTEMEGADEPEDGVLSRRADRLLLSGDDLNEKGESPSGDGRAFTHIITPWSADLGTEVLEVYLPPHAEWTPDPIAFDGRVVCIGVKGRLLLVTRGTEYVMKAGESLAYDGAASHALRNYTDDVTHFYLCITPAAL